MRRRRRGISYLEIQVSLVIFGIALAGICPLVVMQMKLLRRIESTAVSPGNFQVIRGQRIVDGLPYVPEGDLGEPPIAVLQPPADRWVRRLGTAAPFGDRVAIAPSTAYPTESTTDDDSATLSGTWAVQAAADATGGSCRVLAAGSTDGSAVWTIDSIVTGRYRVMISWPGSIPIPTDASFTILDASSASIAVPAAAWTTVDGGPWRDLGNYSLGASVTITLKGSATGPVVADAVRIGTRSTVTIAPLADTDPAPSSVGAARRASVVARP